MGWTEKGGGDHGGNDWIINDDITVSGNHYNINTFKVESDATVTLEKEEVFEVHAENVTIDGYIDGFAKGHPSSSGPGAGEDDTSDDGEGGGAGHACKGKDGDSFGDVEGGDAYGDESSPHVDMGSGGGEGRNGLKGGAGGGCVRIYCDDYNQSGTIDVEGGDSENLNDDECGGGGSGGGILVVCDDFVCSGDLNIRRGRYTGSAGGHGADGRCKIYWYSSYDFTGELIKNDCGTFYDNESGLCNSSYSFGQEFKRENGLNLAINKFRFNVVKVNTSGDFELKLWESTSKDSEIASATANVSDTGDVEFELSDFVTLEDGSTYYVELNPVDDDGDIKLALDCYNDFLKGSYYNNEYEMQGYNAYMSIDGFSHVTDPRIMNNDALDIVQSIANTMLVGASHRINADGSGKVEYNDDFSNEKYLADSIDYSSVTHDTTNNELDIDDDGYIYYKVDTRYPVQGIPTLTATIDITSGEPTIQISSDGSDWYDIDDDIVDDEKTEYDLNSQNNLQLAGKTVFYFRFDCAASGTNSCVLKDFELDVDTITIDAENPLIYTDQNNEFKLEQDVDSSMECTVELIYNDRKWA